MKHLFIVNPVAGGADRTAEVTEKVKAVFKNRSDSFEIYTTRGPMDAVRKINAESEKGEELRVYACGGDGTFSECVTGAVHRQNVAVAPFPGGTGNDFCRMFGKDGELYKDIDALLDGGTHEIDVIDCGDRYSVNICSVGFDARVGTDVHKYCNKYIKGMAAYAVSLIANLAHGLTRPMKIRVGDREFSGEQTLACACNGRFYGGGFNPSCDAMPDDGILDIFIVDKVNIFDLVRLIGRYASGKADEIGEHIVHLKDTYMEIEFEEESVFNTDGEAMYGKSFKLELLHKAVKLIVPQGMSFFNS